jgi:maltose O-acetyltransferase
MMRRSKVALGIKFLPLLRVIGRFDQRSYMRMVVWLLRRARVKVIGAPLWISPTVFFDVGYPQAITIGDRSVISESVKLLTHDFSLDRVSEERGELAGDQELYRRAPVNVGTRAFIGIGAIVMPGTSIGEGAIVGAGSVVTDDVPPHTVVAGNPARILGTTDQIWDKRRSEFEIRKRRR